MIHDNIYHLHPPSKFEWSRTSFYEDPWRWRSDSVFWTSFMFQIQSWMYHESKGNFFFQIKPVFSNSKQLVVSCSSTNKNEIMLCFWSYFYLHDHRYINCLSMIRYEQNLLHLNCYKILNLPKHLDNQDHFRYLKQPL